MLTDMRALKKIIAQKYCHHKATHMDTEKPWHD